jgi:hypothetical protein
MRIDRTVVDLEKFAMLGNIYAFDLACKRRTKKFLHEFNG